MAEAGENPRNQVRHQDSTYLIIVGALLLLIIAALAILWMTERRGRLRAEAEAASAKRISQALQNAIAEFALRPPAATVPATAPISRADAFSKTANIDGRERTVFLISAEAGRRFGFLPGDVIEVGNATTTQASSRTGLRPGDRIIDARRAGD
ncbi:MAG: hypothetical protein ACE15C_03290 [Phycisphaerae bacterium]